MTNNKKRILTRAAGLAAATITTATLLAQPGVAHAAEPAAKPQDPVPCQPNARYATGWRAYGEWVFSRDCKSDGWGILVDAYYKDGSDLVFIADSWDHSSDGNGAWRHYLDAPDGKQVVLVVWETKSDGTPFQRIATIDDRGYHT